jgi:hypothetical protein
MEITEFLLARIGETSEAAKGDGDDWSAFLIADCQAKLRVVDLHNLGGEYTSGSSEIHDFRYCATCGSGEPYEYPVEWPCETIRFLALPYAEHAEYRSEWTP